MSPISHFDAQSEIQTTNRSQAVIMGASRIDRQGKYFDIKWEIFEENIAILSSLWSMSQHDKRGPRKYILHFLWSIRPSLHEVVRSHITKTLQQNCSDSRPGDLAAFIHYWLICLYFQNVKPTLGAMFKHIQHPALVIICFNVSRLPKTVWGTRRNCNNDRL